MKNIWTNGAFDVLHYGHIEMFKYAKSLGDKLIVGTDSDIRLKKHKFPKSSNRPINNEKQRVEFLRSIKYIDEVCLFGDHSYMRHLILFYNIDTIVVGEDYKNSYVVGSELVKNVLFFPRIKSSSAIIEQIQNE
jgi:rfaE bifunctional protein nucleotidyltransferase chain/domain